MKIKELVENPEFDINCRYQIYNGIHNDNGILVYDSAVLKSIPEKVLNADITYITLGLEKRCIIIECSIKGDESK